MHRFYHVLRSEFNLSSGESKSLSVGDSYVSGIVRSHPALYIFGRQSVVDDIFFAHVEELDSYSKSSAQG